MSADKVKFPRKLAEAVEFLRNPENGFSNYAIIGMIYENRNNNDLPELSVIDSYLGQGDHQMHADEFLKGLVNGYEVEESPEEKVRGLFNKPDPFHHGIGETSLAYRDGINDALNALGIKIEGVNA